MFFLIRIFIIFAFLFFASFTAANAVGSTLAAGSTNSAGSANAASFVKASSFAKAPTSGNALGAGRATDNSSTSYDSSAVNSTFTQTLKEKNSGPSRAIHPNTSRYNLILPSIVLHGFQPDPEIVKSMPRKMDSSADFVATPGIGIEYHGEDRILLLGALVKDCFDNLAGAIQVGRRFAIERDSAWAISFGLFIRQTPFVCTKYGCSDLGGDSFIFNTTFNRQSIDIIPLPFLHYSRTIIRSQNFQVNFKLMANFIFNEIGVEVPL